MYVKLVLAFTVFCGVITHIKSDKNYYGRPHMQGYTRIKRGKYISSSPQRFYSRPPVSPQIKGIYSYTPPPNYMANDDEPQYPGTPAHFRPPKVSNRPTTDGLGNEDINNIVKYLSKQDLDKIIDLAGVRDREKYTEDSFEEIKYNRPPKDDYKSIRTNLHDIDNEKTSKKPLTDEDNKLFQALVQEIDIDPKYNSMQESKTVNYNKPIQPIVSYDTQPTPREAYWNNFKNNNNLYDTSALAAEESMLQRQIVFLKSQINDGAVYTDSSIMAEEKLPKPLNLREDYDVSYTNNVPTIVKAEQNSYKIENFGDLPLMGYNSKLDTLSSYHVPHYTVSNEQSFILFDINLQHYRNC